MVRGRVSKSSREAALNKNRVPRRKFCLFCQEKGIPNYKDTDILKKFVTERGKILSRAKTGTCALHQRRLSVAIKRARILALMPFVPTI